MLTPDNYEQESWQLDAEEKLSSVTELRTQGNDAYKVGEWKKAAGYYQEALNRYFSLVSFQSHFPPSRLEVLITRERPGDDEYERLELMKVPLYLNLAQCQLKLIDFYGAIDSATEAIKVVCLFVLHKFSPLQRDAKQSKAYYRRAKAHIAVWNLDDAEKDLKHLKVEFPDCVKIANEELSNVHNLRKQKEQSDKKMYTKMMKRLSTKGE